MKSAMCKCPNCGLGFRHFKNKIEAVKARRVHFNKNHRRVKKH